MWPPGRARPPGTRTSRAGPPWPRSQRSSVGSAGWSSGRGCTGSSWSPTPVPARPTGLEVSRLVGGGHQDDERPAAGWTLPPCCSALGSCRPCPASRTHFRTASLPIPSWVPTRVSAASVPSGARAGVDGSPACSRANREPSPRRGSRHANPRRWGSNRLWPWPPFAALPCACARRGSQAALAPLGRRPHARRWPPPSRQRRSASFASGISQSTLRFRPAPSFPACLHPFRPCLAREWPVFRGRVSSAEPTHGGETR
jgi:hypothetical protein